MLLHHSTITAVNYLYTVTVGALNDCRCEI